MSVKERVISRVTGKEYKSAEVTVDKMSMGGVEYPIVIDPSLPEDYVSFQSLAYAVGGLVPATTPYLVGESASGHVLPRTVVETLVPGKVIAIKPVVDESESTETHEIEEIMRRQDFMYDVQDAVAEALDDAVDTRALHFDVETEPRTVHIVFPEYSVAEAQEFAKKHLFALKTHVTNRLADSVEVTETGDVAVNLEFTKTVEDQHQEDINTVLKESSPVAQTVQPEDDRLIAYELGMSVQAYRHFTERVQRLEDRHQYFLQKTQQRLETLEQQWSRPMIFEGVNG